MKHRRYILSGLCCLALLLVIFFLSHQPGELSYAISDHLGSLIKQFAAAHGINPAKINIRKVAHVALFFLLGLSMALMFLSFFKQKELRHPAFASLIISVIFCTVAAALDEWHQTFIPGRTGQVKDVFIDVAGFGSAILLTEIINFIILIVGRAGNEG